MPAFFNGIYGHKPSTGAVSNLGQIPAAAGAIDTFLVTGPLSRYASDLLPMLKVLLKPNIDRVLRLDEPVDLSKIKIYYMVDDGGFPLVSPVDKELVQAQKVFMDKWCYNYGVNGKADKINLKKLFYSLLIWSNKMASEPTSVSFAQVSLYICLYIY
jgi:fatty acid amide hydrolase 2